MTNFESLILAARDAERAGDIKNSFYVNEKNKAVFVIDYDDLGHELLIEVFVDGDEFRIFGRGQAYGTAVAAIKAATRIVRRNNGC